MTSDLMTLETGHLVYGTGSVRYTVCPVHKVYGTRCVRYTWCMVQIMSGTGYVRYTWCMFVSALNRFASDRLSFTYPHVIRKSGDLVELLTLG